MDLETFLQSLCSRLTDFFYRSFGDDSDSQSGDKDLPIDAEGKWYPVVTMSKPCILHLLNLSANEVQYTFNKNNPIGGRIPANIGIYLQDVSGVLYGKCSDVTKSATLNFCATYIKG